MPAKRHHFLPRFYLDGFLKHNRKQMTVVKTDVGKIFKTDTINVGIETDWNRIGDDRSTAEESFGKIDGVTSRVLKKIFENEILPTEKENRDLLLYLIARLSIHNPSFRKGLQEGLINRMIKKDGYTVNFQHGFFLKHEAKYIQEKIKPLLSKLYLSLLIVKDQTDSFVCSDRPIFISPMFDPVRGKSEKFTHGIAFTLPLNWRMCLYADSFGFLPEVYYIEKENKEVNPILSVPFLNCRTIYGAQRHIYAGDLNWEIDTASGEKRNANSLIGKNIKDVIDAWYNVYPDHDNSVKNIVLDTVRSWVF